MRRIPLILCSLLVAALVIGGAAYYRYTHPLAVKLPPPATAPATAPTTTSRPVVAMKRPKGPTTQILDILRVADPKYPTTQRIDDPLDLRYAARVVLNDPVYLDPEGNLWITRTDGPPTFDFAKASRSHTATHVVRDRVAFAAWSAGERGAWMPHLIVHARAGSGYEIVDDTGRRPLPDPHGFQWHRALTIGGGNRGDALHVVVPTATGACGFAFDQSPEDILASHRALFDAKLVDQRAVQLVADTEGVIIFTTSADGLRGSRGAARYAPPPIKKDAPPDAPRGAFAWTTLTGAGWPDRLLHLVPFLDGSVLQIVSAAPSADAEAGGPAEDVKDKITFSLTSVAASAIDRKRVMALVDDLSADDPEKREAAFKALTTFGPGITPILERTLDTQPPEAKIRIRQLLKNKVTPSLGGMTLVDGKARVANRLPDGGVILYAEAGVALPLVGEEETPEFVVPAWLNIRPGRAIELLRQDIVKDLSPDVQKVIPWGPLDYIVIDPVLGPQWLVGKTLDPLLRKQDRAFTEFAGIDATGRWLFRVPGAASRAATSPATTRATTLAATTAAAATTTSASTQLAVALTSDSVLIIDPHLPDPTPRLPGWLLPASVSKVGWDKDGWPLIYRDAKDGPIPWALGEDDWRAIDEKTEKVFTQATDVPPSPLPPPRGTTKPAATTTTTTTTQEATTQQSSPLNPADFLLAVDGDHYYNGRDTLVVSRADGSTTTWPLPAAAVGTAKPILLHTRENLLFLINAPGRIVRIRPTPDAAESFEMEAVFTRTIPSDPTPLRVWLEPADRICYATGNRVTILFPIGRIPPQIAEKMRPEDFAPEER